MNKRDLRWLLAGVAIAVLAAMVAAMLGRTRPRAGSIAEAAETDAHRHPLLVPPEQRS